MAADRQSPRSRARARARRRLAALVALAIVLVAALLVALAAISFFRTGPEGGPVSVTIPAGSSLGTIGDILERHGVVPHALAFEIRARLDGHASQLKAGTYDLRVNEPFADLIAALVAGTRPRTIRVTIPEGYTIADTAARVAHDVPGFSAATYVSLATHYHGPAPVVGYHPGTTLQGLLFPATYDVLPSVRPRQFIALQLAAFRENMARVDLRRAAAANLTPYDVVTIASLVEAEARAPGDRAKIAAVVWNRLRAGMRLQMDSTVLYALGTHKAVVTYRDLTVRSPYNTYLHAGLPPTPIDNPGLAALTAAAQPARVGYLYFVGRPDGSGPLLFSSTYAQFLHDKTLTGG